MVHDESHLILWHGMYDSVKPKKNSIFLEKWYNGNFNGKSGIFLDLEL